MADDEKFDAKETERRREAALKRMLATPHTPHKAKVDSSKTPKRTAGKGRARVGKSKA